MNAILELKNDRWVATLRQGGETIGEVYGETREEAEGRATICHYALKHMKPDSMGLAGRLLDAMRGER
jgi:hypothetical protein